MPPSDTTSRGARCLAAAKLALLGPLLLCWWWLAFIVAWACTFTVAPCRLLAARMYWACPFVPMIFSAHGTLGRLMRVGFEASYAINVITRFLTLPMRPHLPSFYIVGFPKCGTTALAQHLKQHPGISGPDGLPYHEALTKETHFFEGVLGRRHASSPTLYRSFFPTVVAQWWAQAVRGVPNWMCFDACPVHACLPYVAKRIRHVTPDAKIVVMLRDPAAGVFSAEVMLADLGVPPQWRSLSEPVQLPTDPRFQAPSKEDKELWDRVAELGVHDPLPAELPASLYFSLQGVLRCGHFADLLQPYLECFPPDNIMVIQMADFQAHPEGVVREVLDFVGASQRHYTHRPPPKPAMQNNYKARTLHATCAAKLQQLYHGSNVRLQAMLHKPLPWMAPSADDVEHGRAPLRP